MVARYEYRRPDAGELLRVLWLLLEAGLLGREFACDYYVSSDSGSYRVPQLYLGSAYFLNIVAHLAGLFTLPTSDLI